MDKGKESEYIFNLWSWNDSSKSEFDKGKLAHSDACLLRLEQMMLQELLCR